MSIYDWDKLSGMARRGGYKISSRTYEENKQAILNDPTLTPDQKTERVAALDSLTTIPWELAKTGSVKAADLYHGNPWDPAHRSEVVASGIDPRLQEEFLGLPRGSLTEEDHHGVTPKWPKPAFGQSDDILEEIDYLENQELPYAYFEDYDSTVDEIDDLTQLYFETFEDRPSGSGAAQKVTGLAQDSGVLPRSLNRFGRIPDWARSPDTGVVYPDVVQQLHGKGYHMGDIVDSAMPYLGHALPDLASSLLRKGRNAMLSAPQYAKDGAKLVSLFKKLT